MGRDRARVVQWGSANKPKVSNKVGYPTPGEGSDGDIEVRQTNLGAKLFSKIGGRWYNTPLSVDDKVRVGANLSNHLSIDNDSVDIYKNDVKVSEFGQVVYIGDQQNEHVNISSSGIDVKDGSTSLALFAANSVITGGTITIRNSTNNNDKVVLAEDSFKVYDNNTEVGSFGATTTIGDTSNEHVKLSSDGIEIKDSSTVLAKMVGTTTTLGYHGTTKIVLDGSAGTMAVGSKFSVDSSGVVTVADVLLTGKIGLTGTDNNICIGTNNSDAGDDNISIGADAGSSLADGGNYNICIGTKAGEDSNANDQNVFIGYHAGKEVNRDSGINGSYNTIVGAYSGLNLTTGYGITALGVASGQVTETGNFCTYIGWGAKASGASVDNEVVLCGSNSSGGGATGNGDHTVTLGNTQSTDIYMGANAQATTRAKVMAVHDSSYSGAGGTSPSNITNYMQIYGSIFNKLYLVNGEGNHYEIQAVSSPSGRHTLSGLQDIRYNHSGDNTVITQFYPHAGFGTSDGFKIPAHAIITRVVAVVQTASDQSTHKVNIMMSATHGTAADSSISTPTELLGAGSANADTISTDVALGGTSEDIDLNGDHKKVYMCNTLVRNAGSDQYIYICNAGTGNGTTNSTAGTLSILIEYYGMD